MAPILRAEGLGKAFLHRGRHPTTLRGFVEGGWRGARGRPNARDHSERPSPGKFSGPSGAPRARRARPPAHRASAGPMR